MKLYLLGILVLLVAVIGFSSSYIINQKDRGVLVHNGAAVEVLQPGLGFKTPFVNAVEEINVQNLTSTYNGLTVNSYDQQPTTINVSVSYHIPDGRVMELYKQYGNSENFISRTLDRQAISQISSIFGQYSASDIVQNQGKFNLALKTAIQTALQNDPVVIDSVQTERIKFSPQYEDMIQQKMTATINVAKKEQELQSAEIDAKIAVANAEGKAQSDLAIAKSKAQATQIQGEADAAAIKAKSDALNASPQLVALTAAEKWDGKLPQTMVPNGTVPFLPVK